MWEDSYSCDVCYIELGASEVAIPTLPADELNQAAANDFPNVGDASLAANPAISSNGSETLVPPEGLILGDETAAVNCVSAMDDSIAIDTPATQMMKSTLTWHTCDSCADDHFTTFDLCDDCFVSRFPVDHPHERDDFAETSELVSRN